MNRIPIVLCSRSVIKHDALELALSELGLAADIEVKESPSGVPNQPFGDLQTLAGAFHRAHALRPSYPDRYVLAVENGAARRAARYIDLAYGVMLAPSGLVCIRHSDGVPIPPDLIEAARAADWTVSAGKLEATRTPGCDHADPHRIWSGGTTDRRTLLADLLRDLLSAAFDTTKGA